MSSCWTRTRSSAWVSAQELSRAETHTTRQEAMRASPRRQSMTSAPTAIVAGTARLTMRGTMTSIETVATNIVPLTVICEALAGA